MTTPRRRQRKSDDDDDNNNNNNNNTMTRRRTGTRNDNDNRELNSTTQTTRTAPHTHKVVLVEWDVRDEDSWQRQVERRHRLCWHRGRLGILSLQRGVDVAAPQQQLAHALQKRPRVGVHPGAAQLAAAEQRRGVDHLHHAHVAHQDAVRPGMIRRCTRCTSAHGHIQ
jgi:hypothetical protein